MIRVVILRVLHIQQSASDVEVVQYFVVTKDLPYPMGQAAAETLIVGDEGGKKSITLFTSMAFAALFTILRDGVKLFPAATLNSKQMGYGSLTGVWWSPMLIAVGYVIGPVYVGVWFLGAVLGDFGILVGGTEAGLWDVATAATIKSSL